MSKKMYKKYKKEPEKSEPRVPLPTVQLPTVEKQGKPGFWSPGWWKGAANKLDNFALAAGFVPVVGDAASFLADVGANLARYQYDKNDPTLPEWQRKDIAKANLKSGLGLAGVGALMGLAGTSMPSGTIKSGATGLSRLNRSKVADVVNPDALYESAVKNGDTQTALRLLEEAYLKSGVPKSEITITPEGKPVGWFHGTEFGNHTVFDSSMINSTIGGESAAGKVKGNFLTTDLPSAKRYAGIRDNEFGDSGYTSPSSFLEKVQNSVGLYKPRKQYPAERVASIKPKSNRLRDFGSERPLYHTQDIDNSVYPFYVNPLDRTYNLDFQGRPWSRSPVDFPNTYTLERNVLDDNTKKYFTETKEFEDLDEALGAWKDDPINRIHQYSSIDEMKRKNPFNDGYLWGYNSEPRYENVKLSEHYTPHTTNGAVQYADRHGYNSIYMKNVVDSNGGGIDNAGYPIDDLVVLKPEQLKLADVTYDDAGKLIPLSERFNWNNKDIRYGIVPPALLIVPGAAAAYNRFNNDKKEYADGGQLSNGMTSFDTWRIKRDFRRDYERFLNEGMTPELFNKWGVDFNNIEGDPMDYIRGYLGEGRRVES